MNKLHLNAVELDADYDYCPNCKKAIIGGITADEHGDAHVCASPTDAPKSVTRPISSLHSRQVSPIAGWISLLLLLGNIGLTIYSHIGLSAEIMSNFPPEKYANVKNEPCAGVNSTNTTKLCKTCDAADIDLYYQNGQMQGTDAMNQRCGTRCGIAMLSGPDCSYKCIMAEGYTSHCAYCFAFQGVCVTKTCLHACITNSLAAPCRTCVEANCAPAFRADSGLPMPSYDPNNSSWNAPVSYGGPVPPTPSTEPTSSPTTSSLLQWYGIPEYGQISFVYSVERAFEAGAYALAVIVVIASGIWPYTKCVLMFVAWFVPMSDQACTTILQIVSWLGRFSLVDVLAVLVLAIGIDFDLLDGEVRIRTESRPAIVAFGIVAVWALLQSEWMLRIQLVDMLRAKNYKGIETRSQGLCKRFWDLLSSVPGMLLLAAICFSLVVAALVGPGYTFVIDDLTSKSPGIPREFSLGTLFSDVRIIDFPAIICLVFVIMLPIITPVLVVVWALSGVRTNFAITIAQMGRFCCMDVFFISAVIFGEEYGVLLPSVLAGVSPCYKIAATSHIGYGVIVCIIHGVFNTLLVAALDHNVHWTLSPPLPYASDAGVKKAAS